jgi:hypothetical protein
VPIGGTAGQVLSKINSTDYNTQWIDFTAGTAATGGVFGVTTLTDSVASTSTTTAAVPNSVKTSYDFAATKAKVSVGTAQPSTPSTGDVWVDTAGTATAINAVPLAAYNATGALVYGASAGTAATLAIGTADQQLVVSGGVPAWATSPDIAKATLTTTGDIIYASGSATPARLGIGTAGQVLGIAAGVPSWTTPAAGGGLTALGTVTASAGTAIAFTSIPTTYKHLLVRWFNAYGSDTDSYWNVRVNGDSGSVYASKYVSTNGTTLSAGRSGVYDTVFGNSASASGAIITRLTATSNFYDRFGSGQMIIFDYANTSSRRNMQCHSYGDAGGAVFTNVVDGLYTATGTAITQIDFVRSSTQTITGTFYLYGVS